MSDIQPPQVPRRHRRRRRRHRAGRRRALCGAGRARADVALQAREGRQAARAALEPLRAGRHDAYMANVKKFTDEDRRRGARRQRRLGGRAAQGGGRRQHRRRPGHHPVDQRRRQPVSREAARRDRPRRLPRQEVRRLVPGRARPTCVPTARSGSACRSARAGSDAWSTARACVKAAGFDSFPKDTAGFLKLCKALQGQGHARRLRAGQRHRRRPAGRHWLMWALRRQDGRREQQGRDRQPRDDQGARVRQGAVRRPSSPARCRGSTRTTTRPSSTARSALTTNGISIYYAAKNSQRPEGQGDGGRHPARAVSRSGRSACRPSRTCSSTR